MPKKILVTVPMTPAYRRQVESAAPDAEFIYQDIYADENNVTREAVREAHIILGCCPVAYLKDAENLEFLQLSSAGANLYTEPGVLPAGVKLCNATGAYGLAIGEYMVGVTLELFKKLHLYRDQQAQCRWEDAGPVKTIYGSTALVVGLGDIGGEYAQMLKYLGAYTIGVRRKDTRRPPYLDELHLAGQLDALLRRADILALSLPETGDTRGIISRERLMMLKPGAILINVGRGSAVDTEALCDLLECGRLGGAALDVTDPEPLPSGHRLWKLPNAVITPHISGWYHAAETHRRIVEVCCVNLKAYLSGWELCNPVDFATGYRVSHPDAGQACQAGGK